MWEADNNSREDYVEASNSAIMSKKQVLEIEPESELTFAACPSFTSSVVTHIELRNPSQRRVCFKIKTTAPKQFTVKQNSGVVEPNDGVQIVVTLLKPSKLEETTKHKFLVMSAFAPEGEIDQNTFWSEIHQNDVMSSKLCQL